VTSGRGPSDHVVDAIAIDNPASLRATVEAFLRGDRRQTALELYYDLEGSTRLLDLHTILREGPQNRMSSGLQQSYGDHNRLLVLGLDKLVEGDLVWYRQRLDDAEDVSDEALLGCFRAVGALGLTRDVLVSLWIAGALHDCGMLTGRATHVDVEDGVVLARTIVETLVPAGTSGLAYFVIHQHDYIKDVFLGEVPPRYVAGELASLPDRLRPVALAALGLVQVAGAASLGDGRLSAFRPDICRRCIDGTALDGESRLTRLGRLLASAHAVDGPPTAVASSALHALGEQSVPTFERFLDRGSLHGWHRSMSDRACSDRMRLLVAVAESWSAASEPEHVVLASRALGGEPEIHRTRIDVALNGSRVLVIDE